MTRLGPDRVVSPATPRRRLSGLIIGGGIAPRAYVATAGAVFVVVLALWLLVGIANLAPARILPGLGEVLDRLWSLTLDGTLPNDMAASIWRILVGFAIATALAVPIGILIGTYGLFEAAVEPLVDFVRYMPVVGFISLTIIWVGINDMQKFSIVFIGTFFQEVLLVMDNVKRVPKELVDIGYTLGLRDPAVLRTIIFPAAAPAIWDTLRISLGWAWTWVVLAELIAANSGLGYRITVAQRYFQTDTIIGYLLVLGILGLITDQTMKLTGRVIFRWAER
jgi:NitT/TauT family transport system permease protein